MAKKMKILRITQVKSGIGYKPKAKATLRALGLRPLGRRPLALGLRPS